MPLNEGTVLLEITLDIELEFDVSDVCCLGVLQSVRVCNTFEVLVSSPPPFDLSFLLLHTRELVQSSP